MTLSADWWDCLPCDGRGWGSLWLSAEQREAIHAKLCHVHRAQLEQERKLWDQMGENFKEMMKDPVRKKDSVREKLEEGRRNVAAMRRASGRKGRYT